MSNPLVCQILGGVLSLFFIFLLVMCWKTWRVLHILSALFVFAGADEMNGDLNLLAVVDCGDHFRTLWQLLVGANQRCQARNLSLRPDVGIQKAVYFRDH